MASAGDPVYNLTDRVQTFVTSPSDVPELDKDQEYWIYDFLEKAVVMPESTKTVGGGLGAGDYKWFVFLPKGQNGSCLGLSDKYCGFTAVEAMFTEGNTDTVVLKGTGNVSWISGKRPGPDPFPRETCGCKTEALRSEKKVFSGEALMEGGIVLPIMHGDYPCVQIYLNAPVS